MTQRARNDDRLTIGVLYGFRALMVLFVCNYHFWQQSWLAQQVTIAGQAIRFDFFTRSSYLFVDGMLLLSGFLLYLPHAQAAAHGTALPATRDFFWKRFQRIVPSYFASVLIMAVLAFADGAYKSAGAGIADVAAHLTFTFPFFRATYMHTPLNGVLWTIGIEAQFYLLFPLIARCTRRNPALALSLMAGAGLIFRAALGLAQPDLSMLVNQLPSFLDVYALGMLGAILYVRLRRLAESKSVKSWIAALSVPLFLLSLFALAHILRFQSASGTNGIDALRLSQWIVRLPLAVTMLAAMLSAAFLPRFLQKPLDNRLMRFLSGISLNLYIWHQVLAAKLIRPFFPDSLHSDPSLQAAYTLTCYSLSILTAMAFTYGLEHPAAKRIQSIWQKRRLNHERPTAAETQ